MSILGGPGPQPGDWVSITARVVARPTPENVEVEMFSRTDQYTTLVRRDLCQPAEKPIPDEPANDSVAMVGRDAYQRVGNLWIGIADHSGLTWPELCRLGDVEVIHHG